MFEFRRSSTKSRWQLPPPLVSPPPIRTLDPPVLSPAPSRFEEGAFEWCKCNRDEKRIDCIGSIDVGLGGYLVHHGARRWMRTIYPPLFGRQHPEPKSPYDIDIPQIQSRIPGSTASGCTVFRLHPDPGQAPPRDQPSLYVCWDWHWEKPPECYDADGNAVTPVPIVDSTNTEGQLPRPSTQQNHTRNPYPTHLTCLNLHCSTSPSKISGGDADVSTRGIDTEHENYLPREIINSGCLTLDSNNTHGYCTGSTPDAGEKGKKAPRSKHWRLGNYLTSLSGMSSLLWRGKDKLKLPVLTGGIASDVAIHGEVPGSWPSEPEFNYDVVTNQVRESPVMSAESRIAKNLEGNDHDEASGKVMQDELEVESIIHKVTRLTGARKPMPLGDYTHQLEVSETLDLSGLSGLSGQSTSEMAPNSSTKQSAQPLKSLEDCHDYEEHSERSGVAELPAIATEAKAIARALDVVAATNLPNTLTHHNRDGINSKITHIPEQKVGVLSPLVTAVTDIDGLRSSLDRSLKSPLKSTSNPLPTFTIANSCSNSAGIARAQQGLRFSYRRGSDSSGPDRRRVGDREFSSTNLSRLIAGNKVLGQQPSNALRKWTFESMELRCKTSLPEFDDYPPTPWKVICVDGQDAPILVHQSGNSDLNSDFKLTLVCQYLDKKLYEEKPLWIKMHLLSSLSVPFISTPAASPPGIAPYTIQDYLEQTIAGPNLNPRWEVVAGFLSSHLSKQALSIPWCHVSGDFHLLNVCESDWADYATLTYQTLQEQGSMHVPRGGLVLARDARTFMDFLEAVMGVDSDPINVDHDNGWTETWVASVVDPALCTRYHRTVWQEASQLLSNPPSKNWLMQELALAKQAWERRGEQVIEAGASGDISRLQFAPAQHASVVHGTKKPEIAENHYKVGFGATVGLHSRISVASFMNPTNEVQDEYSTKPDILDLGFILQNSTPARGVSFDLSDCTAEFEAKPPQWRTFTPPPISDEQHTSIGKIALTPSSPKIDPLDAYETAEMEPLIENRNLDTYSEMGSVRFVNGLATPPGTPPVTPFTNPLEIATPPSSPPPRTRNRGSLANLNSDWWQVAPSFPENGYGYFNLTDSYSPLNTIPSYRSRLRSPSAFDNNIGCIDLSGPTESTGSDIDAYGEFDPQLLMSPLALSAPPPMGAQDGENYELELELEPSLEADIGFSRNTNTNNLESGVEIKSRTGVDRQEVAPGVGQFNGDVRPSEVTFSDKQSIGHDDDTHCKAIRNAMQPGLSLANDDWDDFYCSQLLRTNTSMGVAASKSPGVQEGRSANVDKLEQVSEMRGHVGSIKIEEGVLANPPTECHMQQCRPVHRCYAERRIHNRVNNKGLVHTHDQIIRELKDFVKKKELEVFFKDDEEEKVLHNLACQVSKNINPTSQSVDAAKHLLDLSKTALYTTIFLVDDSTSVKQNQLGGPLIKALTKATEMATTLKLHNRDQNSTDGKDNQSSAEIIVRFLNNRTTHAMDRVSSVAQMRAILKKIKWKGGTELGTMLQKKVLEPFVLEKARNGTLKQPVLVKIITDGKPEEYKARTSSKYKGKGIMKGEPPETLKQVVLNCKKELGKTKYGEHAVAFQMIQIGDNQDADGYLNQLAADPEVGKHIYCTSEHLDTQVVRYSTPGRGLTQAYNHWWIDETLVAIDPDCEDEAGSCGNNIQNVDRVPEFRNGSTCCSNLR